MVPKTVSTAHHRVVPHLGHNIFFINLSCCMTSAIAVHNLRSRPLLWKTINWLSIRLIEYSCVLSIEITVKEILVS